MTTLHLDLADYKRLEAEAWRRMSLGWKLEIVRGVICACSIHTGNAVPFLRGESDLPSGRRIVYCIREAAIKSCKVDGNINTVAIRLVDWAFTHWLEDTSTCIQTWKT